MENKNRIKLRFICHNCNKIYGIYHDNKNIRIVELNSLVFCWHICSRCKNQSVTDAFFKDSRIAKKILKEKKENGI